MRPDGQSCRRMMKQLQKARDHVFRAGSVLRRQRTPGGKTVDYLWRGRGRGLRAHPDRSARIDRAVHFKGDEATAALALSPSRARPKRRPCRCTWEVMRQGPATTRLSTAIGPSMRFNTRWHRRRRKLSPNTTCTIATSLGIA